MTKRSLYDFLLVFVFSLLLASLVFVFSSLIVIYDLDFYNYEFIKHGVYEKFHDADVIVNNLINYFDDKSNLLDIYSNREVVHLGDVKNLINSLRIFYYLISFVFSFGCLFLFFKKYKYLDLIFVYGGIAVIFKVLALFLFGLFGFDFLFTAFHKLSFNNDFWILSERDVLINLFSVDFFLDGFVRILIYSLFFAVLLLIAGIAIKKRLK